nr:hypothetical protein [Halimeda borneensis]
MLYKLNLNNNLTLFWCFFAKTNQRKPFLSQPSSGTARSSSGYYAWFGSGSAVLRIAHSSPQAGGNRGLFNTYKMYLISQAVGRLLLQLKPPQLREAAQRIGHLIIQFENILLYCVNDVVIPVALYCRTLGLLIVKIYFLFKLTLLGVELYKLLRNVFLRRVVPPSVSYHGGDI